MTVSSTTILDRLRELQADCGDNKHDQAIALISACILEGWNTAGQIVGALEAIGMKRGHAWTMLKKHTGANPARHYWREKCGIYSLLEAAHDRAA